jgi:hypothetical protein
MNKNQTTDEQITKFLLTGFFKEDGLSKKFKMTLSPVNLPLEEKYKWLDDDSSVAFLEEEPAYLLPQIEKRSQAKNVYCGYGEDPLGEFTFAFEIHDNQTPAVGLGKEPREDNDVVMFKKYNNNIPHGIIIIYIGKFENPNKIIGQWFILGAKGDFEINCEGAF